MAGWLALVCATIVAMIVVGGITRLTGSGLSMVDWQPIMGVLPPANESEWQDAFEAYKQFPEYREVNRGMDLEGFKRIFFWEYVHRLLGRLIGVVFFVPLVLFWWRGSIEPRFKPGLVVAFVLGALQGLLGWYMVKSGLVDIPRVSHYRLAAHLSLAMFLLCYLFWLMLAIAGVERRRVSPGLNRWVMVLVVLVVIQIVYGAFTAGMDAGYGYNTWPLMNGQFMADAVFFMQPWWINFFESGATIQFLHRWIAVAVVAAALVVWVTARREAGVVKWTAASLAAARIIQFGIGVLTLIHVVPVSLGVLHQGWACVVLIALVSMIYACRPAHDRQEANESLPGTNQYDAG